MDSGEHARLLGQAVLPLIFGLTANMLGDSCH